MVTCGRDKAQGEWWGRGGRFEVAGAKGVYQGVSKHLCAMSQNLGEPIS